MVRSERKHESGSSQQDVRDHCRSENFPQEYITIGIQEGNLEWIREKYSPGTIFRLQRHRMRSCRHGSRDLLI